MYFTKILIEPLIKYENNEFSKRISKNNFFYFIHLHSMEMVNENSSLNISNFKYFLKIIYTRFIDLHKSIF